MPKYNYLKDFSPQAMQVLENAQVECMRMMHAEIGTEHLLLGLLMVSDGEASKLLSKQAISLNRTRNQVDLLRGQHGYITLEPKPSVSATHSLYLAWQYAMLSGGKVETEHILLALLKKEGTKDAVNVMKELRIDLGLLEADLMALLESKRSASDFARRLQRESDEEQGESHD